MEAPLEEALAKVTWPLAGARLGCLGNGRGVRQPRLVVRRRRGHGWIRLVEIEEAQGRVSNAEYAADESSE